MLNFRGWSVLYQDGSTATEADTDWKAVKKNQINKLSLCYDGRKWELVSKGGYLQKKQASMVPGMPETFRVESRSIGYYDGNSKIWYTVDELTGAMKINVEG